MSEVTQPDLMEQLDHLERAQAELIQQRNDLLAALKWAMVRLSYDRRIKGQNDKYCDAVDNARAAIARAERGPRA